MIIKCRQRRLSYYFPQGCCRTFPWSCSSSTDLLSTVIAGFYPAASRWRRTGEFKHLPHQKEAGSNRVDLLRQEDAPNKSKVDQT